MSLVFVEKGLPADTGQDGSGRESGMDQRDQMEWEEKDPFPETSDVLASSGEYIRRNVLKDS